jgi:tyrosyl-tRNA synthetase
MTAVAPAVSLHSSASALTGILASSPDLLRRDDAADAILALLAERRRMDLSDLDPRGQAELIAARAARLLPGVDRLTELLSAARAENRALTVKFGIDPTAADVHLGHTVPMILAARFQRMGHRVVFIVGDVTARIGDPSGRTGDRPPLTDEDVRRNLGTYRAQVSPFFDFERAEFRFNSEWLAEITLPQLLGVLEKLPASASLQREDFRTRLANGSGLTMAELVYSVVMALDSVEVGADVELGGIDQLLNMQMCRRVMENAARSPELVVATGLIEGTDGTGAKMSKSKNNYVALAGAPGDVFGKLMSAADRLLPDYLRALTELLDPEIDLLLEGMRDGRIHPMGVKTLLAADVTATIHGPQAAADARAAFRAQFSRSRRRFSDAADVTPVSIAAHGDISAGAAFVTLAGTVNGMKQVRRVAADGGLRLVVEARVADAGTDTDTEEMVTEETVLTAADVDRPLAALLTEHVGRLGGGQGEIGPDARVFLRCGRRLVELRL